MTSIVQRFTLLTDAAPRDSIVAFFYGLTASLPPRNLLAVDVQPTAELLEVRRICSLNVMAKPPTDNTCVGVVYGVDEYLDATDIAANIDLAVPVVSCTRRGWCVIITFEGTTVPSKVFLFKLCSPVRPRLPRPL
ncbi:uncharacterized protein LOC119163142 [Rhipicephalus microplus]|uniref:uncharacterized protein LOC119163142 n=1 Tax=Rhipicephalus microplus TaxID=6941 RepID=UPI003F6A8FE2